MTPEQFAYWLQGCFELNPGMEAPTPEQWKVIKDHLATVFVKVTPPFPSIPKISPTIGVPHDKALMDYMRLNPMQVTC